jgi:tetratricopeptide (TPR) repeat protein
LKELYSGLNNNEKTEKLNEMIARTCHDEVDVILNQGKKHLEHGEYDKAYQLFLPVLKKMVKMKNFKTPISLLNLILTYNSDYLPAQKKLMAIYQFMGDKKGLNTLFDFLLPMLKFKKNKRDFIEIVLELSQLTDHPDQAEQQVARVREQKTSEIEHKLINTNLNIMKDLVKKGHYKVASGILEQLLRVYPNKIEVGIHPEKTDLPVSQAE